MPSLIASIGANIAPFVSGLAEAKSKAKSEGGGISSALGNELSGKLKGLVAFGAGEEAIRQTVEYGSKVQDLANRLGISTTAVQQWDYALKQNGSSIDAAAGFFEQLAVARENVMKGGEKGQALADNFTKLGISIERLKSSRIEDIAAVIAKTFEQGDPQQLIGSLKAVGGKSAGELAAAFREGLAGALDEAPLISPEDIASLDKAADAVGRLKAEFTSGLAPAVAAVAEGIEKFYQGLKAAAGVPIGFAVGVVQHIKENPFASGLDALRAGKKNATDMYWGSVMDAAAREDEANAKEERLKKGRMHGTGATEDDSKEKAAREKAVHKAETAERALDEQRAKAADRVQKIHEQIAETQRKTAMEGMSADQKRAALAAQIAKLKSERDPYGEATDEEIATRDLEISKRESDLANVKDDKHPAAKYEVNSLQKVGGFLGAPATDIPLLDTTKRSEQHLARIRTLLEAQSGGGGEY
jgi:hypothetical protein